MNVEDMTIDPKPVFHGLGFMREETDKHYPKMTVHNPTPAVMKQVGSLTQTKLEIVGPL